MPQCRGDCLAEDLIGHYADCFGRVFFMVTSQDRHSELPSILHTRTPAALPWNTRASDARPRISNILDGGCQQRSWCTSVACTRRSSPYSRLNACGRHTFIHACCLAPSAKDKVYAHTEFDSYLGWCRICCGGLCTATLLGAQQRYSTRASVLQHTLARTYILRKPRTLQV